MVRSLREQRDKARVKINSLGLVDDLEVSALTFLDQCYGTLQRRDQRYPLWKQTAIWVGGLSAALAAASSATSFTKALAGQSSWAAAILALASAVLTALVTGLDPRARTVRNGLERARYELIFYDYIDLLAGVGPGLNQAEFRTALRAIRVRYLTQREEDVSARSPD